MFCLTVTSFSQDPLFSQFYANSLYLSPSFVGATDDYRFSLNYRNQWPGVSNIYNTYSFSFDKNFDSFNSGLGLLATHDVAGAGNLSTTNIGILYSYDFKVTDDWHVRPGIQFKLRYLGLDISKLIFVHQILASSPPSSPPLYDNVADIDFAASAMAYNENIWGGITVDHLLRPEESFYDNQSNVPIKFNVFGGIKFLKRSRLIIKRAYTDNLFLAFNFQKQKGFYQTDIGAYYNTDILIFGLWYRGIPFLTSQPGDAIIGMVGIRTNYVNIGYSYDFTISSLITSSGGSHELSLTYEFTYKHNIKREKIKALPCPDF